jgi:hypothetical protein
MKRPFRLPPSALCWLALLLGASPVAAQVLQDLSATLYSPHYLRGVNHSSLGANNIPANKVQLDGVTATPRQFRGAVFQGAVVLPRSNPTLRAGQAYEQHSVELNLPRLEVNGNVSVVLRSSTVGASTFGRLSSFSFGAVISPPVTDEGGRLLAKPEAYWAAEPYSTNVAKPHHNAPYYWSPHARQVFATQPGPISVSWRAAQPASGTLATANKVTIGGLDYALTNVSYVVSGAAVKKPKQLYWTEKGFRSSGSGKPVSVPASRVGAVYFHYNSAFPSTVPPANEYRELGSSSPTDGSTNAVLQELRTAWYDNAQGLILAYNLQGRVFLELLGDPTGGETRRHLGFEIVDVLRQPTAVDLTAELGEKLTAYADRRPDLDLEPSPVLTGVSGNFLYSDPLGSNGRGDYYAIKETVNLNDVLVHWLEEGESGLRWPLLFGRYRQMWPEDLTRYTHYIRPAAKTKMEAEATAVQLPGDNVPYLQYQDRPDGERGFLNEKGQYYSWLSPSQPVHRALLRFNAGERVAFERVLSLLDSSITPPNLGAGTAARDLVSLGVAPGRSTYLYANAATALPALTGLDFNSQAFTLESWVYVPSTTAAPGDLMVLKLGAKTLQAGLSLGPEAPGPFIDISGTPLNTTLLGSANSDLNAGNAVGGLRFTANMMFSGPGTDPTAWGAYIFAGGTPGPRVIGNNNPSAIFLMRANGVLSVFENGNLSSDLGAGALWMSGGDQRGRLQRVDFVMTDDASADGDPFNGAGNSRFRMFVNLNGKPVFDRAMGGPTGYSANYIGAQDYRPSVTNNWVGRITRMADGDGFGVSSQRMPVGRWVHVAMVGDEAAVRIYLDGALAGEGSNSKALRGTVTSGTFGAANVAYDNVRLWSRARSQNEILADLNALTPGNRTGLELEYTFNGVEFVAANSSGISGRDLPLYQVFYVPYPVPYYYGYILTGTPDRPQAVDWRALPRFASMTVKVGDRIAPPAGESVELAGYISPAGGDSYNAAAYKNPFEGGFDAAKAGAIIPVNAIPGRDALEIWWFRPGPTNAVRNASNGFKPVYWPAVLGRYKLAWPENPANEIVLASNQGSGALESLQAKGIIYTQNDPKKVGYNPNEEHALMVGGQVYALRDDLNVTSTNGFSSQAYALLDYTAADGRPAMRAFKVLREKPEAGILFDYVAEAGKQLQAPMPLPFLPPPVVTVTNGTTIVETNFNHEVVSTLRDLPAGWSAGAALGAYSAYEKFTYRDRKETFWVFRGPHSGLPKLEAGTYIANRRLFDTNLTAGGAINTPFTNYIHTSRRIKTLVAASTNLPPGLTFGPLGDALAVYGTLTANSGTATLTVTDQDGETATVVLNFSATPFQQDRLNINNRLNRPPMLAHVAEAGETIPTNSLGMRFYYKTQDGFAWPGWETPPAPGTIVPYLRPLSEGRYVGAGDSRLSRPLDIIYRPVWPQDAPAVDYGETLMEASAGRPAIRGQTSVQILYQQAIATTGVDRGEAGAAVVLHDPTREKSFALKANSADGLNALPGGVKAESYQGKTYFPNLPPHLAERFFLDPNRGANGSLVFKGEFKDEAFGEKFVLLNVLSGSDLKFVRDLCPATDKDKASWDRAIDSMEVKVETSIKDLAAPSGYVVQPTYTVSRGITELVAITNANSAVDSYALSAAGPGSGFVTVIVGNGGAFTPPGEPVSMYVLRVAGSLYRGEIKILESSNPLNEFITFEHTADLGGKFEDYEYEWKIGPPVDGFPPVVDGSMSRYQALASGRDLKRFTLGGSGIRTLVDNYIVMRYRPKHDRHPLREQWSPWTRPQLAEGWIKRVLARINPFNQRVTDLYNNSVNTDVSILTQAGKRFEGDIALNMASMNNYGLIEIYETVLNRGRGLSIDAGINFGPANDALLLAAGYINDLYMLVGNEAFADASNPTIGIGTKDREYGDIATALFAFRGQVPSLLEEELTLLRGRDDIALPGVEIAPVYNRLVWNYTRGIDAGEVVYALNYNILDQNTDGKADAADAARLYPQGHGDAYGHYLTAIKGYYSLLLNPNFEWVPRVEAVTVLGQPVSVDYLDERKLAAGAAALVRAGRHIFDLTWRRDYLPGRTSGWEHLSAHRTSSRVVTNGTAAASIVRHWGADQWASRTSQGAFLNWVVGNAILPDVDPDPSHEGIQKVDRTTVPELTELVYTLIDLQASTDNAEARMTPVGLAENSIAFDINPNLVVESGDAQPHFEQVYNRAKTTLNNAVVAFDDAKDITRLMRSEEDSLAELRAMLAEQELGFTNALIELYGTPYPDDIGAGRTYRQGYEGPDLIHYAYVETPELSFGGNLDPRSSTEFRLDIQSLPASWVVGTQSGKDAFNFFDLYDPSSPGGPTNKFVYYNLSPHGYFAKPASWQGKRRSPGEIQQAISDVIKARNDVAEAMAAGVTLKQKLNGQIRVYKAGEEAHHKVTDAELGLEIANQVVENVERAFEIYEKAQETVKSLAEAQEEAIREAFPRMLIAGLAAGGDLTSVGRAASRAARGAVAGVIDAAAVAKASVIAAIKAANEASATGVEFGVIRPTERTQERLEQLVELDATLRELQDYPNAINRTLQQLDDAQRAVAALVARGDRLLAERQVTRQRTAAVIQGFRTRDAAFRIFRNEKLERYKSLFDLAARYAFLAATAYDYDTGQLGTPKGKAFINRIISSRALGVVKDGEPQFAGSNTGDPGLSSALAEMKADYDVMKSRLSFIAPDAYNTLASLRVGNFRILPDTNGLSAWREELQRSRMDNILDDPDVRRHCQQADAGNGLPVPGLVIRFSTSINPGENLFGKPLAGGDSSFHRSYFATKVHSVGVALEGYIGMNYPGKSSSTNEPNLSYLDPQALAANPYVYLIPTGADIMRSPPLGDGSQLRQWNVDDVAIPLPFNIGGSDFSSKRFYASADSLTEPLFTIRKHQAFRPTDSTKPFEADIYNASGLQFSQFTNRRLVGRSVWNTEWKLVIPGDTLLADAKEGLTRLIDTVTDIKLYYITYSHSGN